VHQKIVGCTPTLVGNKFVSFVTVYTLFVYTHTLSHNGMKHSISVLFALFTPLCAPNMADTPGELCCYDIVTIYTVIATTPTSKLCFTTSVIVTDVLLHEASCWIFGCCPRSPGPRLAIHCWLSFLVIYEFLLRPSKAFPLLSRRLNIVLWSSCCRGAHRFVPSPCKKEPSVFLGIC
jgi:hypothetical protein